MASVETSGANSTCAPRSLPASHFLPPGSQPRGPEPADKPALAPFNLCMVCAFQLDPWHRQGSQPGPALLCHWRHHRPTPLGLGPGQHHPSTHTLTSKKSYAELFFKDFLHACLVCRVVRSVKARNIVFPQK